MGGNHRINQAAIYAESAFFFLPTTVQPDSVGGVIGTYKPSPMQGGGVDDQEQGKLIRTFDPTIAADRADAESVYTPNNGCDFSLRIVQGGITKHYIIPASVIAGCTLSNSTFKTVAGNLRADDGEVTRVELLLTPDVEHDGLSVNPQVFDTWQ